RGHRGVLRRAPAAPFDLRANQSVVGIMRIDDSEEHRYHLEILTTPTQVRNALCYVLQNARRHRVRLDTRCHGADPFSSAWWFDGWQDASWKLALDPPEMRTVADAESWLLRIGWQRAKAGRLAIDEVPAAGRE